MKIGLATEFDAAHRLPGYPGKCARVHGHTYRVEAVLDGPVGEDGFVMDFFLVKEMLAAAVSEMDHRDLNEVEPNPTAEHLAYRIYRHLDQELQGHGVSLVSIRLWEGKNKWVMIEGDSQ
ncbi:MAG: Dihydroneopterin monophosphate aldolase [Methanosaeta sp. PtaB.Bin039]|nr:MAG: Dihydroneopterin monophosphate aldolase [Methanosaeta sp. PtaB.Bin039]OPY44367.1 MAG: Dihydroneopterin monophosphate aldolase [Methanosaeta sp. PtaU1.Bin028]HOT06231.1 6-carboxytetrahydropterin synthase QueD [Methanotrichaceae archaeon]HQF15459.1 6-carboxytetrahydropterin synthase QueD [Methanotrichaceae archaeon]HQI90194.1 6-carboxytetrahydropterin synthase QueD [Methanotrichaceae archaeon]